MNASARTTRRNSAAPVNFAAHRAGFTILELIAAVTITVMITGAALLIFTNVTNAQQRIERDMAIQQEARAALRAVTDALHNLQRPAGRGDNNDDDGPVFEGIDMTLDGLPSDSLRFTTISRRTVRAGEAESDVHEIEFQRDPGSADRPPALTQRTDPTHNPEPDRGGVVERVAEHIAALEIRYYANGEWFDDWPEERNGLPAAVHVTVIATDPTVEPGAAAQARQLDRFIVSRMVHFPRRRGQTVEPLQWTQQPQEGM